MGPDTQQEYANRPLNLQRMKQAMIPRPARVAIPGISDQTVSDSTKMLLALGRTRKHLYLGTVDPQVVARRRAKNKAARAARRVHRG